MNTCYTFVPMSNLYGIDCNIKLIKAGIGPNPQSKFGPRIMNATINK